ncbi:MAG: glycogen debranching protein [Succinivibrionaceae bacterium]
MAEIGKIAEGNCIRLGAVLDEKGVNFAIYCKMARQMELLLFSHAEDLSPTVIKLDMSHKSSYYFHVYVPGVKEGQLYAWRVTSVIRKDGVYWDPTKALLDPYCHRIIFPKNYSREANSLPGSNLHCCPKSVVLDPDNYNWEDDAFPKNRFRRTVIYEMHVKGFTAHPSSGIAPDRRGTYAGVIDKIPYLKQLGITAVELLPTFQFDPYPESSGKINYWGYDPISYFIPHASYSSDQSLYGPINEFRDMVKALHRENIEVYLDVVYNHTAEGDARGPIFNLKGLANSDYYLLNSQNNYLNYTGCGNTINASSPVVKRMIIDSLHFWVEKMHVDGFRFDLASILSRNSKGEPISDPPTLLAIDNDCRLANTKIIAEAWDAAGLYQVGSLPGKRWREWNGQFRDVVRSFVRGDAGQVSNLVNRFCGSPDIYDSTDNDPYKSLNFITCHDGFTLNDLVTYNEKHNEANRENNRDGADFNCSSNYGTEGPSDNVSLQELRLRQAKNFMYINLASLGTSMILMGDEILRTQHGNNNAYCQDNEISYMNWDLNDYQKEMFRFTSQLVRTKTMYITGDNYSTLVTLADQLRSQQPTLHGVKPYLPDLKETSHSIGILYYDLMQKTYAYVYMNAYWEGINIQLPKVPNSSRAVWFRTIDTNLITQEAENIYNKPLDRCQDSYYVQPRSIVSFISDERIARDGVKVNNISKI